MIGFAGKSLSCLIWKHFSPFVCGSTPVHFSTSSEREKLSIATTLLELLVHKYKFSPVSASRVASHLSHLQTPEKADSILSFFKEIGCSNAHLLRMVKHLPRVLACSLEGTIKPKIKILQDEGFSCDDINKIISFNPVIFQLSVENSIIPSLSMLKGVLGSNDDIAKVLSLTRYILKPNLKDILVPNIEFLKSCGIPMKQILIFLNSYPGCFVVKPDTMRRSAEKAKEMGLNASSYNFTYAVATITKMKSDGWELKLQAFRDMGFSESDISAMFRRAPLVFNGSVEKIKKVIEVLIATGKFDMSSIVNHPRSLAYSVENRFIPRLQVLEILDRRKLIKTWPPLGMICSISDVSFFMKFIIPYLDEASELCITQLFTRVMNEMKKPG